MNFAHRSSAHLDAGEPITALAGVHSGCYELFAHEPIRTISDLKGKRVGIQALGSSGHLFLAIMAAHVGLDPDKDINWVTPARSANAMELFADGKIDAFLGFPPEPQELRARKIGRVIVNTATDQPWSQYFCCMLSGNRDFVREHPIATKRVPARHPQGRRPLRRRAGAGRAAAGRWRVHASATTTRSRR